MRKLVLSSSLIIALAMVGCGSNRFGTSPVQQIAVKSATLDSDTNIITTTDDYTTITLVGGFGSKVFINNKEVGIFPESGSLEVTFDVTTIGSHKFNIYSTNLGGDSQTITIEILKEQKSANLGNIETTGQANNLTASKNGIIFIAEKSHGVEVISIDMMTK